MKIISKPDITGWKCSVTCGACTSKLMLDANDLQFRVEKQWWSDELFGGGSYQPVDVYYVVCPVCSKDVTVLYHNIPFLIREQTKKKPKTEPKE